MRLIINADDYALTKGVSEGIIQGIKTGVITDATAMANMEYFTESIEVAKRVGISKMGIHFTLTAGKPVSQCEQMNTIVNEEGCFYKLNEITPENIDCKQIEKELRAQLDMFLKTGMTLNHIDSHHHIYGFNDELFEIVANLAKEYNVPMRCPFDKHRELLKRIGVKTTDKFIKDFYGEDISEEMLINLLENNKDFKGSIEIMVHPAIVDNEILQKSSYNKVREKELSILTSKRVLKYIKDNNIELISYSDL
ncbi:hypothetical protein SAMN02745163_04531 [Clostridium cavendishii DSM 21758]|uniref:Carbohydrate deacetylase n=1 Tax=Clostridium cavendishii DSM 21758 TaxID=1121302 RepID=A0A1M6VMJ5_9CLOT|nr:chitin disaccharide deacetylase [Clostridium cavendishii]SHK82720.1 hypothetical protein SAMN02745163_04531 [Clostridium cavendishii DSM 21758]